MCFEIMVQTEQIKKDIRARIDKYSSTLLGGNLQFSLIFGRLAYSSHLKTDIDVLFLTKTTLDNNTKDLMIENYFALHRHFGMIPDSQFPGEYITLDELRMAQEGEGFRYSVEGVKIPEIQEWNDFNNPRHHLTSVGMLTKFVNGNYSSYKREKEKCIRTLLSVVLLANNLSDFDLEELIDLTIGSGKNFLGFSDHLPQRNYLRRSFKKQLIQLSELQYIKGDGTRFSVVDSSFLRTLEKNIARYNRRHKQ